MTVPAVHAWPSNAYLIEDVARLGYIRGRVVDLTYGKGTFWKRYRPDDLTEHDLRLDGVDYRNLPEDAATYDTVVFDPPYKLTGTPQEAEFAGRYGLEAGVNWQVRLAGILAGVKEAHRVCAPGGHVLVKVQDQVCSGQVRWVTTKVHLCAEEYRGVLVDRFDMIGSSRPQPNGRRQVHAHGRPSTLLVFRKAER